MPLTERPDMPGNGVDRFRTVADAAPVMVWAANTTGACTYLNAGWLRFTGRTFEQAAGDGWSESVHRDDVARCLRVFRTHFRRRAEFEMEYRLRRHDGEYRWVLDHGVPLIGAGGEFEGFIGTCLDVTERRELQGRDRLLAQIGFLLEQPESLDDRLGELARTVLPLLADVCVVHLNDAAGEPVPAATAHVDPEFATLLAALPPPLPGTPIARGRGREPPRSSSPRSAPR